MHRSPPHSVLAGLCLMAQIGCAPIVTEGAEGGRIEHRFGYVRVRLPAEIQGVQPVRVRSISTLGVTVAEGVTIGWAAHEAAEVPLDCRFVALIRNRAEAEAIVELLKSLEGNSPCVGVMPPP